MLFRSLAAVTALLVASTPVAAQELDLRAQVAAFVQPSNEARTAVVVAQLRAAGFEPAIETFAGGNGRTGEMEGRNVVVTIGDGPREILLTAHYDAVKLRDGTMSHGVVDNAASVVGLIEAAKILRGKALSHRIRIILFDQEELGLIGARKWIEAHGLANVAAVVNSDVAGYGDTMMYGQKAPSLPSSPARCRNCAPSGRCSASAFRSIRRPMIAPSPPPVPRWCRWASRTRSAPTRCGWPSTAARPTAWPRASSRRCSV